MFSTNRLRVVTALLVTIAAMLSTTHPSMAQSGAPNAPSQPASQIYATNDPHNPLHLTTEQQVNMLKLKEQFQNEAAVIFQNSALSQSEKQTQLMALQKAAIAKVNAGFTPEQASKAHAIVALQTQSKAEYASLNTELAASLSKAQKVQLSQIRSAAQQQATKINSNSDSASAKQQELLALQASYRQQIGTLWTPSQRVLIAKITQIANDEKSREAKIFAGN
jgi:hypothetical protein